jgi:hypothetical protein
MGRTSGPLWNSTYGGVFRWTRETGMAPLDNSAALYGYPRMSANGATIAWWAGPVGDDSRVWSEDIGLIVFNDQNYLTALSENTALTGIQ